MGIASSVINRYTASPHKAAGGLLEALTKRASQGAGGIKDAALFADRFAGMIASDADNTDVAPSMVGLLAEPFRTAKKDPTPWNIYAATVGPLGALGGKGGPKAQGKGLESRLMARQAAAKEAREKAQGQADHMSAALTDPYEKELGVYGLSETGERVTRTTDLAKLLAEHPRATVHNRTPRWGGTGAAHDTYRQTFILDRDGNIHMAQDWGGVHHPDLVEVSGVIPGYKAGTGRLPSRAEMHEAGVLQGEITHAGDPSGAMYGDRMRVTGWGQVNANEAQTKTLREIAEAAHRKGVVMEHASLRPKPEKGLTDGGIVKMLMGSETGPPDLEGQARAVLKRLGHGTSKSLRGDPPVRALPGAIWQTDDVASFEKAYGLTSLAKRGINAQRRARGKDPIPFVSKSERARSGGTRN
jgi:hypothetical protein